MDLLEIGENLQQHVFAMPKTKGWKERFSYPHIPNLLIFLIGPSIIIILLLLLRTIALCTLAKAFALASLA